MKTIKPTLGFVVLFFALALPRLAMAQGAIPYLDEPLEGCYDVAVYGVGLYDGGQGEVTIAPPPGDVVLALMEWVGAEDTTPGGLALDGTSELTIQKRIGGATVATVTLTGAPADALLPNGSGGFVGSAGYDPKGFTNAGPRGWFAWNAELGPGAPGLIPAQFAQPITLAIADWDSPARQTNGASITLVYRTAPAGSACAISNKIQVLTGIDTYHQSTNEDISELLVFDIDPAPIARTVRMFFSHAGTDRNQSECRGGAIWMAVGDSSASRPGAGNFVTDYEIVALGDNNGDGTARGYGINGGVEIVNDPFTSADLPCSPRLNPVPDEDYAAGHPYPGGAGTAPYRALSMIPAAGGDVGQPGEWGVVEVRVVLPPNTRWMAYQLESERDQNGESGGWVGNGVFAVIPTSTLGDRAWEDLNGNGLQENGEPGIANVGVQLRNTAGAELGTTTTSSAGLYQFTDLVAGQYELRFTAPAGYRATARQVGGGANSMQDSDIDPATGLTGPIDLAPSEVDLNWDAGYYRPVVIGDYVWIDTNGDGIQGTGEPGLNGVTVRLLGAGPDASFGTADDVTATTVTAANAQGNGYYRFADQAPGRFQVTFELPAGYRFTLPNVGDDTRDSDADPTTGRTQTFQVGSGQQNLSIDAGLIRLSPDIRIVKSPDLQKIARGATAAFQITVENIGENALIDVTVTDPLAPDCDAAIGDLAVGASQTYACQLERVDADFVNVATVTGRDALGNQVQDSDDAVVDVLPTVELAKLADPATRPEPGGVFNFTLVVRNTASEPVTITELTDTNPLPGACRDLIGRSIPVGGARNCQYPVTHEAIDIYVNDATVTVIDDEENRASAAAQATVAVYDVPPTILVEKSANPTEVVATGEDVTFTATVFNTTIEPLTLFYFADDIHGPLHGQGNCRLPQTLAVGGSYTCQFTAFVTPGETGETDTITARANDDEGNVATASDTATVMPIAVVADASVGDFVWNDLNTNGLQDAGELGVEGVAVRLFTPEGEVVDETTTDAQGFYRISNLFPGEYYLGFAPAGGDFVSFSPLNAGNDRAVDSDVFQAAGSSGQVQGRTIVFTLSPGEYDDTWDAGLVAPTAISLVRFEAESWDNAVQISWETSAEVGTLGYHLHRGTGAGRENAARITNTLLPAQGPDGGVYQFTDVSVIPGITYFYWLEEVAENGSTEYGPITITVFSAQRESRVMLPLIQR
jgi:uncharacterized repeat protein (TIGR01451 family)